MHFCHIFERCERALEDEPARCRFRCKLNDNRTPKGFSHEHYVRVTAQNITQGSSCRAGILEYPVCRWRSFASSIAAIVKGEDTHLEAGLKVSKPWNTCGDVSAITVREEDYRPLRVGFAEPSV